MFVFLYETMLLHRFLQRSIIIVTLALMLMWLWRVACSWLTC